MGGIRASLWWRFLQTIIQGAYIIIFMECESLEGCDEGHSVVYEVIFDLFDLSV